jgi:hypothetical protein
LEIRHCNGPYRHFWRWAPAYIAKNGEAEGENMAKEDGKTIYRFCGEGLGIPGLPHDITRDIARESGVLAELDAAIAAGVYIAVAEKPAPEA